MYSSFADVGGILIRGIPGYDEGAVQLPTWVTWVAYSRRWCTSNTPVGGYQDFGFQDPKILSVTRGS